MTNNMDDKYDLQHMAAKVDPSSIVVAMSGGVDSSVAALLMHQQGYTCVGVSMQVWDYRNSGGCSSRATCCAPDDFTDARVVAAKVGIPYYVFDFEKSFRREVIDNFIETYSRGETPNPCVDCNNKVKFKELRERALRMNCRGIATGHYARIVADEKDGHSLLRGADREKDQSYFLYGTPQSQLEKTFFPLGELTKSEVRAIASQYGLPTASKPESQDICFVSGSVRDFLVTIGVRTRTGHVKRADGTIVGTHDGIQHFTVGQRRGLGVGGADEALYVTEIEPETNSVIVGTKGELERVSFTVHLENVLCSSFDSLLGTRGARCVVQVRHRHGGSHCLARRSASDENVVDVEVDEALSIAPGQAAVFYDVENERVLGGGRIVRDTRGRPSLERTTSSRSDSPRSEGHQGSYE